MHTTPRFPVPGCRSAGARRARARLHTLLLALLLAGCGKEAPREAPPQNGKPVAPAEADGIEGAKEKKQEAEQAPSPERSVGGGLPAPPPPQAPAAAAPSSGAADSKAPLRQEEPRAKPAAKRARGALDDEAASNRPRQLRQQLAEAVKLSTPDCPSARERKQAICDLAAQICQLVDRDPDVASVESYCSDAKQRCGEAGRRTAERCK